MEVLAFYRFSKPNPPAFSDPLLNFRAHRARRLHIESLEDRLALDASLILDINMSLVAAGSFPREFTQVGDDVYFVAQSSMRDEIWKTDGEITSQVLSLIDDIVVANTPFEEFLLEGHIGAINNLFAWDSGIGFNLSTSRTFFSDGTPQTVHFTGEILGQVGDWHFNIERDVLLRVEPGESIVLVHGVAQTPTANPKTAAYAELNGSLILPRNDELGISDGTVEGSGTLFEIEGLNSLRPHSFQATGDRVFFFSLQAASHDLWTTDGTTDGTVLVETLASLNDEAAFAPDVRETIGYDNELFFVYRHDPATPFQVWRSDGTGRGTFAIAEMSFDGQLQQPLALGDKTVLIDLREGFEIIGETEIRQFAHLIVNDGTSLGTEHLTPNPVRLGDNPEFTVVGDTALFVAFTTDMGFELWSTDGTVAGTGPLLDIHVGSASARPTQLFAFNDEVFFAAEADNGRELWITDGTVAGTREIADIANGPSSSNPSDFRIFNGRVLFMAENDSSGRELWVTDGTTEGTHLMADVNPGPGDSDPDQFTEFGDLLVFTAHSDVFGSELWSTDGTPQGTMMMFDLAPGPRSATPNNITVIGEQIYFSAQAGQMGFEPWVTDGTPEGTRLIANLRAEYTAAAMPRDLTVQGSRVFFCRQRWYPRR